MIIIVNEVGDRPVVYFGARHWHWNRDKEIAEAAIKGGAVTTSTDAGSEVIGEQGVGTIPHALENVYAWEHGKDSAVLESTKAFDTLIRRFPDSKYTRDAKLKRDLTLDHLAGKEMEIGRYYLVRGHMNAALNRFQSVVKDYQTTTHVAEALHRIVEVNLTLGLVEEATKVAAVLGHNYPGSQWYEQSYKLLDPSARQRILDDRSFVDRTVESLFKPD